jgi:hypothetical protein
MLIGGTWVSALAVALHLIGSRQDIEMSRGSFSPASSFTDDEINTISYKDKMLRKAVFIALILGLGMSCGPQAPSVSKYSLQPSRKITFELQPPHQNLNRGRGLQRWGDYLVFQSFFTNSIQFYRLDNGQMDFEIPIAEEGPEKVGRISGFYILAPDSVFVIGSHAYSIVLTDRQGQAMRRYSLAETRSGEPIGTTLAQNSFPILSQGGKLFFPTLPYYNSDLVSSAGKGLDISLDLATGAVDYSYRYPSAFEALGPLPARLHIARRAYHPARQELIYSFSALPELYIKNLATGRERVVPMAGSSHAVRLPPPAQADFQDSHRYYMSNTIFKDIIYDPYREVYYRMIYLPVEPLDELTGERTSEDDKPVVILILDEDYQQIGQYPLPPKTYYEQAWFLDQTGLWLSRMHLENPDYEEGKMVFQLLELVEK